MISCYFGYALCNMNGVIDKSFLVTFLHTENVDLKIAVSMQQMRLSVKA
jgi:hypothetical protein